MSDLRQGMRNFQLPPLKSPYQLVAEVGIQSFFSHSGAYQVDYRNLFLKFFHTLYFLVDIADVTEAWSKHKTK